MEMQSQLDFAPPPASASRSGKALMSLCGALLLPGLGHLLAGRTLRAAGWFSACLTVASLTLIVLLMPQLLWALAIMLPLNALVFIAHLVDAARCGRSSPKPMLGIPAARLLVAIGLAIGAFFAHINALRLFEGVFVLCRTNTPSMSPTILPGDWYLSLKRYPVARWSIVGATDPHDSTRPDYVKRIVGLPGERVEVTGAALLINGQPVPAPTAVGKYLAVDRWNRPLSRPDPGRAGNGCWGRPITLGPDEYFVLGDHTVDSDDSRLWPPFEGRQPGALPQDKITTRAAAILWPPHRWQVFP